MKKFGITQSHVEQRLERSHMTCQYHGAFEVKTLPVGSGSIVPIRVIHVQLICEFYVSLVR